MNHLRLKFLIPIAVSILTFPMSLIGQVSIFQLGGADNNALPAAAQFLAITPDSRAGALGNTGVANLPDAYSMHGNVGKYAFTEDAMGIAISFTPWLRNLIPEINLLYLSGYGKIDSKNTISSSIRYFSLGNVIFTNLTGTVTGEYSPFEFAVDAGYTRQFNKNFSAGLAVRYIHSNMTNDQPTANGQVLEPGISFAGDFGLYYQRDVQLGRMDGRWATGASITNIGTRISYIEDSEKIPIPTNLRIGGRFQLISDHHSFSLSLEANKLLVPTPPVLETSMSGETKVVRGKEYPSELFLGMIQSFYDAPGVLRPNGNYSTFFEEMNEISYGLGFEYIAMKMLAVRSGYFYEHQTKGNRKYLTIGTGIRVKFASIDFSYLFPVRNQNSPLKNTFRLSLAFEF